MIFASDNWAGAAPEISRSLENHAKGYSAAYGDGEIDRKVEVLFSEIFEKDCDVYVVGTGTAANSLAAAACAKPGGVVFCHSEAHLIANEGGAPEFLTGGNRMVPVSGSAGKIDPEALRSTVAKYPGTFNHLGQGTMVSITQATEAGTVYSIAETGEIGNIVREAGLRLHMDGARFANAMVKLDCSAAEMTWKQGVDLVSFGGTKNGCWCAEALVVLNGDLREEFRFLRKRMGHLFSKSRFVSAQFEAYFQDDLWLRLARQSNRIGEMLEKAILESTHVKLAWPSHSNQVFFIAERDFAQKLMDAGARFYPFAMPQELQGKLDSTEQVYRLVASYCSTDKDVEQFAQLIK